ncbi:MAG: hypothetical protein Q8P41_18295 [Pseudomonadota bacterium]|nr:hypothetical protein [Pseudomonadota bacterium]
MLVLLVLVFLGGCSGTNTLPPDSGDARTNIDDTGVSCGPGTHEEDGLCLPDEDTGVPVDTDTAETGGETGETGDTAPETGETGDTVVETTPCADGYILRTEVTGLDGAAICDGVSSVDYYSPFSAPPAACGEGWHVCTAAQWRDRNDSCESTITFAALLDEASTNPEDDGVNNCAVSHDWEYASCSRDEANTGLIGTCNIEGGTEATYYGTASRTNASHRGASNELGTLAAACCTDG